MRSAPALWLAGVCLVGCGNLERLGGPTAPLVAFEVLATGDLGSIRPANDPGETSLQIALVWGTQWQVEPFCLLPPESAEAAAVIAAGCRDPFGFVPNRVAGSVPVTPGTQVSLPFYDLPGADVMVGDVTSRVAYGSLVLYNDRNGNGSLDLARPGRTPGGGDDQGRGDDSIDSTDVVHGASFWTMTAPDQRVAFREGTFNASSAFYPRSGCGEPPPQFSILAAGGFSPLDGLTSAVAGRLPLQDPASCSELPPSATVVHIAARDPATVSEVACIQRREDSSVRYRQPPAQAPDLSGRVSACARLPSFDRQEQSSLIQLVISGRRGDRCKGLTHYTLRGCREEVGCAVPDWDFTAAPPAWWPCPR